MHQFTALSVPTPLSLFGRFFGGSRYQWLAIAKVWSEVGEVLESDVFGELLLFLPPKGGSCIKLSNLLQTDIEESLSNIEYTSFYFQVCAHSIFSSIVMLI
jgi:hypothetical protein